MKGKKPLKHLEYQTRIMNYLLNEELQDSPDHSIEALNQEAHCPIRVEKR